MDYDDVLTEESTEESIEESNEESTEESTEEFTGEFIEESSGETFDYDRLESAVLQDDFTLDTDLDDLFLTDVLLLLVVFILVVIFASKEV